MESVASLIKELERQDKQKEREWFESLLNTIEQGEIELAKESIRGAIEILTHQDVSNAG